MTMPPQQNNPTETLELQLQNIIEIVEDQKEQIQILKAQNENISALIGIANGLRKKDGFFHVKIENINMPFFALVGFFVKVSLASIPAALIISILTFIFVFLLSVLFGSFFGVLGSLIGI